MDILLTDLKLPRAKGVELQQENRLLRQQLPNRPGFGGIIGLSVKMERINRSRRGGLCGKKDNAFPQARGLIQKRLRQAPKENESAANADGTNGDEVLEKFCGTN